MANTPIFKEKKYKKLDKFNVSIFEGQTIVWPLEFLLRTIQNAAQVAPRLTSKMTKIDFIPLIGYVCNERDRSSNVISQEVFNIGIDFDARFTLTYDVAQINTSKAMSLMESFTDQRPLNLIFGSKYLSLSMEEKSRHLINPILTYIYLQTYYLANVDDKNIVERTVREWYDDYVDPRETGWGQRYDFTEAFSKMIDNDIEIVEYLFDLMIDHKYDEVLNAFKDYGYIFPRLNQFVEIIVSNPNYNEFMIYNNGSVNIRTL